MPLTAGSARTEPLARDRLRQMAHAPLNLRLLPAEDRRAAEAAWTALEQRLPSAGLFCRWTWTRTWLEHFGDQVPHAFVIAERGGVPVGAVLLADGVGRRRGPFPIRTLHLGTAGEAAADSVFVQYNRLLVAPSDRVEFARALLGLARRRRWDELHLDGFTPEDAEALVAAEPRLEMTRMPCPTMDLELVREAEGDVLSALRSSVRWRIRRSLRAVGPVEVDWATDTATAMEIFEELIALHQARWTAVESPGVFASARFTAFHRALIPRLMEEGSVMLFRVRTADGTLGCLYGHVEDGRLLQYQSGLATTEDNRVKPGLVVHALCMEACLERGLLAYDMLAGGVRYKRELANSERELAWGHVAARRPRAMLIHGARRLRALRRTDEQPLDQPAADKA